MRSLAVLLVVAGFAAPVAAQPAPTQPKARAGYSDPLLVLDTPGRTGACDVLTFTRDGRQLLAAGDDKVVRTWDWAAGTLKPRDPLRWGVWQQRRGAIYTVALSPDPGQQFAAVAGLGMADGAVVVIDRQTGRVVHGTTGDADAARGVAIPTTVWSLAFNPAGNELAIGTDNGEVWVWRFQTGPKALTRLGRHTNGGRILLAWYADNGQLLTVARNGDGLVWAANRPAGNPTPLPLFRMQDRAQVVISRNGGRLAAVGSRSGPTQLKAEVVDRGGGAGLIIPVAATDFADCIGLSDDGSQLALGLIHLPGGTPRYRLTNPRVLHYNLGQGPLAGVAPRATQVASLTFQLDRFAFSPDGNTLAVAGGKDDDVTVYDLRVTPPARITQVSGPGNGLWGIGLSADGSRVGWQTDRSRAQLTPNGAGAGPWSVFDLGRRKRVPADDFSPVPPIETQDGWTVRETTVPTPSGARRVAFEAIGADGQSAVLTLSVIDSQPTCYTFLPPVPGKPTRVAVGHTWGWSLFQLGPTGARRVRVYNGHAGAVTALAPSRDGRLMLTASRDQTIAAWLLDDWPTSHPHLGAKFEVRLNRLLVKAVDAGSPAWDAGLTVGDRVDLFADGSGTIVYDPKRLLQANDPRIPQGGVSTDPRAPLKLLEEAVPHRQLYFWVFRNGELLEMATRVRQRPVWMMFPTRDSDWVLWKPTDATYDASPGGDRWIGWQVSAGIDGTPTFHRARDSDGFGRLYRPDLVARTIRTLRFEPGKLRIPETATPEPRLTIDAPDPAVTGARITAQAIPRGDREVHQADRVVLWVGDYRYREWDQPARNFRQTMVIPPADLRTGVNQITLQVFGKDGGVDKRQVSVTKVGPPRNRRLFALLVGVSTYEETKPPGMWGPLDGVKVDMANLEVNLPDWARKAFSDVKVISLPDGKATPEAVLGQLQAFRDKDKVGPDDVVLLYLGGHGYCEEFGKVRGTFTFVGPRFDMAAPADTGLTTDALFKGLTSLPATKVVLLMACHSGDATTTALSDPVRQLTPGGVGPVVLAACEPTESAWVDPIDGSLFTQAIVAAVGNKDVSVRSLAKEVQARVPRLLEDLKDAARKEPNPKLRRFDLTKYATVTQRPQLYAPDPDVPAGLVLFRP